MVCEKCEKKLSKAAVPEVWKEGSRSAGAGRDGGRSVARNTMLKSNTGFAPHLKTCRVCKTKLSQDAAYCNQCAFAKGICAMCGVAIADLRMDKRGVEWPGGKKRRVSADDDGDGDGDEEADEAAAGSGANAAGDGAKGEPPPTTVAKKAKKAKKGGAAKGGGSGGSGGGRSGGAAVSAGVDMEAIARRMAAARNATVGDARTKPLQQPVSLAHREQLQQQQQHGSSSSSSAAAAAAAVWQTATDAASGKVYYYNTQTGVTQWTAPPELAAATGGGGEEGGSAAGASATAGAATATGGGDKWKSAVDASSGRTYYYHADTGETKWAS